MPGNASSILLPLPRSWHRSVRSAMLQVISLAQFALAYTRGWAANSPNVRIRLGGKYDQSRQEAALLREEIRIKDARMAQIPPQQRPHYPPTERMAILELKAARGWSLEKTAKRFLVTAATVASWLRRLDEEGPDALVQLRQPVNRFPDFVRYSVHRLKALSPLMGKVKIAQILARAGLHLGATTVGRMLHEKPKPPTLPPAHAEPDGKQRVVTAKYPNHVWHVDLTTVPTGGFWTTWLPFALPQCWPFCWWVEVVIDHFSRRVMGTTAFPNQPSCQEVCGVLGRTVAKAGRAPRHIICDRGKQFDCQGFRDWCRRKGIKRPRYGAIGKHGSLAVIERLILTVKLLLRCLPLVPLRNGAFRREVGLAVQWYNRLRPHTWLGGKTPDEVYYGAFPANRKPRFEPRAKWPRGAPCARPWALVRGGPGATLAINVSFYHGRKHLPVVTVKRAA
jgi:putative transposase